MNKYLKEFKLPCVFIFISVNLLSTDSRLIMSMECVYEVQLFFLTISYLKKNGRYTRRISILVPKKKHHMDLQLLFAPGQRGFKSDLSYSPNSCYRSIISLPSTSSPLRVAGKC